MSKSFILTFVKNGVAMPILQRALVQDIQREKAKLMKDTKYRDGIFQIRTTEGFKAKKIL